MFLLSLSTTSVSKKVLARGDDQRLNWEDLGEISSLASYSLGGARISLAARAVEPGRATDTALPLAEMASVRMAGAAKQHVGWSST